MVKMLSHLRDSLLQIFWRRKTLLSKILILIIPVAIVGTIIISIFAANLVKNVLYEEAIRDAQITATDVAMDLNRWILRCLAETRTCAYEMEARLRSGKYSLQELFNPAYIDYLNETRFKAMDELFPGAYDSMCLCSLGGDNTLFVYRKEKRAHRLNFSDEKWYQDMIADERESFCTPPYFDLTTKQSVQTVLTFIKDSKGNRVGFALAGVNLEYIMKESLSSRTSMETINFFVDEKGDLLDMGISKNCH